MGQPVTDRRTFLKAAGSAVVGVGVGVGVAQRALGRVRPARVADISPTQGADDPIAAQADALAYDQAAIFRFVADEIAYEPCAGVLRGPRATLAGRAGNAADKALLLAARLDASVIPARYVMGSLDEAVAARLAGIMVDADAARGRWGAAVSTTEGGSRWSSGRPSWSW
jgi:hypothetical protein